MAFAPTRREMFGLGSWTAIGSLIQSTDKILNNNAPSDNQTFPIATYAASGNWRDKAIESGFNLLHSRFVNDEPNRTISMLDKAKSLGSKAIVELPSANRSSFENIGEISRHSAIAAWLIDEPDNEPPEKLQSARDFLRNWRADVPFGISVHYAGKRPWYFLERFNGVFDYATINSYPMRSDDPNLSQRLHAPIGRWLEAKQNGFDNVWLTLQNFKSGSKRRVSQEEFRFWIYAALTVGVRGFWIYKLDEQNPPPDHGNVGHFFNNGLAHELKQFREFVDQFPNPLSSHSHRFLYEFRERTWANSSGLPKSPWPWIKPTPWNFAALFWNNNATFAVVVNGLEIERKFIKVPIGKGFIGAKILPVGTTRNVTMRVNSNGTLKIGRNAGNDKIRPWEAFVIQLK